MPREILVTGSTIGRALARAFADDPTVSQVHLTYHSQPAGLNHPRITEHPLDVTDEDQITQLITRLKQLDGIVNCVGLLHDKSLQPEKSISRVSATQLAASIELNTLPTLLLAKQSRILLRKSPKAFFASVSARVGSIEENSLGGWYSYRASKAALNMVLKTLSIEWQRALPHCSVAALHPGTVASPLSEPFSRNVKAEKLFTPQYSASCLKRNIDQLTPDNSGRFWSWDGRELPW